MLKKTKGLFVIALSVAFVGISIPSFARQVASYNITTPRQGSITTGSLTKANSSRGVHNNTAIGGNKRINTSIRRRSNNADITPSYNMGAGSRILLNYSGGGSAYRGVNTTLGVATPITTTVQVQAQGSWSPDE
jgi:endonuclease I